MPRRLITFLLTFWFALQGMGAIAMPLCIHASSPSVMTEAQSSLTDLAAGLEEHCNHQASGFAFCSEFNQCDTCGACFAAYAVLLVTPLSEMQFDASHQRAENAPAFYYQLLSERPQKPPLNPFQAG